MGGLYLREKTPQSILWIDSSPFGGGADNVMQEITRQGYALPPSLLKRDVRRVAPIIRWVCLLTQKISRLRSK
jgi:hypothetical protein